MVYTSSVYKGRKRSPPEIFWNTSEDAKKFHVVIDRLQPRITRNFASQKKIKKSFVK